MFFNKKLLYKGQSLEEYNRIINTLELNNIKYSDKIENKGNNDMSMIDKNKIGNFGKKEDFSYEYIISVKKEDYEYAQSLIKNI